MQERLLELKLLAKDMQVSVRTIAKEERRFQFDAEDLNIKSTRLKTRVDNLPKREIISVMDKRQIVLKLRSEADAVAMELDTLKQASRKELKKLSRERADNEEALEELESNLRFTKKDALYWEGEYESQQAVYVVV